MLTGTAAIGRSAGRLGSRHPGAARSLGSTTAAVLSTGVLTVAAVLSWPSLLGGAGTELEAGGPAPSAPSTSLPAQPADPAGPLVLDADLLSLVATVPAPLTTPPSVDDQAVDSSAPEATEADPPASTVTSTTDQQATTSTIDRSTTSTTTSTSVLTPTLVTAKGVDSTPAVTRRPLPPTSLPWLLSTTSTTIATSTETTSARTTTTTTPTLTTPTARPGTSTTSSTTRPSTTTSASTTRPSSTTSTTVPTSRPSSTTTTAPTTSAPTTRPSSTTTTTAPTTTTTTRPGGPSGQVVWQENFDQLDTSTWALEHSTYGDGNNELQCYRPENVWVSGGKLVLRARTETYTCPNGSTRQVTSGMVRSRGVTFSPGQALEFRVKLTPANENDQGGLWPAVWSSGWAGGGWPLGGEMDYLEVMTAINPYRSIYSIHYAKPDGSHGVTNKPVVDDEYFSRAWHTVRFDYGRNGVLTWYLDGVQVFQVTSVPTRQGYPAPFDQPVREIKINLALGGRPGPLAPGALGSTGATFEVDYIRILNL